MHTYEDVFFYSYGNNCEQVASSDMTSTNLLVAVQYINPNKCMHLFFGKFYVRRKLIHSRFKGVKVQPDNFSPTEVEIEYLIMEDAHIYIPPRRLAINW